MKPFSLCYALLLAYTCSVGPVVVLAESTASLEARVANLEKRVAELEGEGTRRLQVVSPPNYTPVPDPTGLLSTMRAVPYFKEGRSIGLRLFAIKANSYWDNAGLKNGDILLEINGKSISDNERLIAGLGDINKSRKSETSFKLERNREEMTIKYKEP